MYNYVYISEKRDLHHGFKLSCLRLIMKTSYNFMLVYKHRNTHYVKSWVKNWNIVFLLQLHLIYMYLFNWSVM